MIAEKFDIGAPGILVGIGDDAAVLSVSPGKHLVASCDMLVEGVHFDLSYTTPRQLGWKALAVNLSDLAAMGAEPRFALLSLGLAGGTGIEFVEEFLDGLKLLGDQCQTVLCGGDTVRTTAGLVVNITVLGEVSSDEIITRSGARPGDLIAITGCPGRSAAGLSILKENAQGLLPPEICAKMLNAHLEPFPRLREGRLLAQRRIASALDDISDGLAKEVREIAEASGTGALLHAAALPEDDALQYAARALGQDPLTWILGGGEDYELVFTIPPDRMMELKQLRAPGGPPVTVIGEIVDQSDGVFLELAGSKRLQLNDLGYDHFSGEHGLRP